MQFTDLLKTSNFNADKQGLDKNKQKMLKIKYQILADYDNTAFNTKIGVAENKIPDVSRAVTN